METKFYFFSGKGGVGKTTMSSSTAINYADSGKKALIITTDPASNLADVFEQEIGNEIVEIKDVKNLYAMELDPDKTTEAYKERTLGPLRGLLPEESFKVLEEQLNSPCTSEMATFERFTDFVQENDFDVIIFDTAPTGHTLRLLQLPVEWSNVIEKASKENSSGQTCIGPATALAESKEKFDRALKIMRDAKTTNFVFVLKPEATSIYEVKRTLKELSEVKINSYELVVNGLLPAEYCNNPLLINRYLKQQEFLNQIKENFDCKARLIYLFENEIIGVDKLRGISKFLMKAPTLLNDYSPEKLSDLNDGENENAEEIPILAEDVLNTFKPKKGGVRKIFFAGKGGVGKSSVASITAFWLAKKGYKTLLLTTDPASHLAQIFEQDIKDKPTQFKENDHLYITYIDTKKATQDYKDKILKEAKEKYDEKRLMAIEEELDSPCTEEMATFEKFIDYASNKNFEVMVFDTAPTGHTLRLLALPVDWSKQLEIKTFVSLESDVDKATKSKFKGVIEMLKDPEQTTFSFVMYPERTPIEEASRAIKELSEIGINVNMVVANMVISDSIVTNDFFKKRFDMQQKYLKLMDKRFNCSIIKLPLLENDIMGTDNISYAAKIFLGN